MVRRDGRYLLARTCNQCGELLPGNRFHEKNAVCNACRHIGTDSGEFYDQMQELTASAPRHRAPWEQWEDRAVDPASGFTIKELAVALHRTHSAVRNRRRRLYPTDKEMDPREGIWMIIREREGTRAVRE